MIAECCLCTRNSDKTKERSYIRCRNPNTNQNICESCYGGTCPENTCTMCNNPILWWYVKVPNNYLTMNDKVTVSSLQKSILCTGGNLICYECFRKDFNNNEEKDRKIQMCHKCKGFSYNGHCTCNPLPKEKSNCDCIKRYKVFSKMMLRLKMILLIMLLFIIRVIKK